MVKALLPFVLENWLGWLALHCMSIPAYLVADSQLICFDFGMFPPTSRFSVGSFLLLIALKYWDATGNVGLKLVAARGFARRVASNEEAGEEVVSSSGWVYPNPRYPGQAETLAEVVKCGLWPKGPESGRPKLPAALLQLKLLTGRLGSSAWLEGETDLRRIRTD